MQQITGASPEVQAWSCGKYGTQWAILMVTPRQRRFLDQLTTTVDLAAARAVLQEVIRLAAQAPVLIDEQLRFRLRALAECAAPDSAPGGQPAPHDTVGSAP